MKMAKGYIAKFFIKQMYILLMAQIQRVKIHLLLLWDSLAIVVFVKCFQFYTY